MDEDIELCRSILHGVVIGASKVAHNVTDLDRELSSDEQWDQHLAVFGLQLIGHVLIEIGAGVAQARREQNW